MYLRNSNAFAAVEWSRLQAAVRGQRLFEFKHALPWLLTRPYTGHTDLKGEEY